MMSAIAPAARQNNLLCESAEWRLLGLLFECPSPQWGEQIASLAAEVSDAGLKAATEAAQREASEGLFHSIFGPGGPAPGREISYRNWTQPGYLLAELSSYYEAFAFQPAMIEAPDHVSVEAAFVAYMRFKEAYALARGDDEHASVTREAAQQFMTEHLSMMTEPLAHSLEHSGIQYLALAGKSLLARVGPKHEKALGRDLPVVSDLLRSEDDASEFGCGET